MRSGRSTEAPMFPSWRRWRCHDSSGPHRRRLNRHALRARHQIKLEFDQFRRTVIIWLRPDAEDATAQAPLQRAKRLPFQPVLWVAGRVGLRDRRAREMLVPIVVVAVRAGQIELALPL